METGILKLAEAEVKYSFLKDGDNNWLQFWYVIIPKKPEQIAKQLKTIEKAESELYETFKIEVESVAAKRFFSSDLINHSREFINYKKRQAGDFFMSLTGQPPASGVKATLLGMCLSNIKVNSKFREGKIFRFDTTSGIRHIFAESIIDANADEHADSEKQTKRIFGFLKDKFSDFHASFAESVLRTWIYVPHIDADYPGMVKARKEFFDSVNLTKDTRYIASTGIQGKSGDRFARVFMDAYAATGVNKGKIRYIQAPEYLSPTHIYGVTFERATAVELGKSDFLFISGTASIDKEGAVVHPENVKKQTEHTLQNISALISSAGFARKDLSSFIVYLRDPADYDFVKPRIDRYAKNLPAVYVKAPACRPSWLIEIEATAARFLK